MPRRTLRFLNRFTGSASARAWHGWRRRTSSSPIPRLNSDRYRGWRPHGTDTSPARAVFQLGCSGQGGHHTVRAVPVKPEGCHASSAVRPDVGQPRRDPRRQQLLRQRVPSEARVHCRHRCTPTSCAPRSEVTGGPDLVTVAPWVRAGRRVSAYRLEHDRWHAVVWVLRMIRADPDRPAEPL